MYIKTIHKPATEVILDFAGLSLCDIDFRLDELSLGPEALESRESLLLSILRI